MHYHDFVIQLEPDDGDGHPVRVLKSPAGEGRGRFRSPLNPAQVQGLWHDLERIPRRRGDPGTAPAAPETRDVHLGGPSTDLRAVGAKLFDALFEGQVRSLYDRSLGAIGSSPEHGLRIKLKLDPGDARLAAVYALPWEYLHYAETEDSLCLSRRSPLVRYLDVPRPTQPIPLPSRLRILVAISGPLGLPPLDLERERRLIEEALGKSPGVEVVFLPQATLSALREALLGGRFHVLHFMGHGGFQAASGEGVVYLENVDGSAHALSGRNLATKLKDLDSLGLVFLNACKTARTPDGTVGHPFSGVASALVLGGLPAVVAMQFPISDRAAITFSDAFYRRLAAGDSVDEAMTEGRQAVHSVDPGSQEWGTPVLFVRVPDGTIFQRPTVAGTSRDARSRWISLTASVLTLILTISLVVAIFFREPKESELEARLAAGQTIPVDVGHTFATNVEGFDGRLTNIELLQNGRMRLNFEFTNNTGRDREIDFHNGRTYLADDFGNRYGVVLAADPADAPTAPVQRSVPAGGSGSYSLEFPAPRRGSKVLNVGLEPTSGDGAAKPQFFQIEIAQKLPPEVLQEPELVEEPAGALVREIEGERLASSVEGFEGKVARVALLDEQTMRWDLEFFNRSGQDQIFGLHYDRIYLADELGNYYPVLRSSQHGSGEAVNAFEGPVQRAVRVDHWLEFPAPVNGAKRFTLHLAGTESSAPSFQSYAVTIPHEDLARYSRVSAPEPSPPSLETWELDRAFDNSLDGLESRLYAVRLLANGRTRWDLRLFNRSNRDLTFGFNYAASYLADGAGHRYEVVAADTGAAPDRAVKITLRPGLRGDHWLEFPRPKEGTTSFKMRLLSHDEQRLEYAAIEVSPLTFPAAFAPAPAGARDFAPGSQVLAIGHSFPTGVEGLEARLTEVELMENSRMRWHFEILNLTGRDLSVAFDLVRSRLRDRTDHEYRVLSTADQGPQPLPRFLRVEPWLEFASPRDRAREFVAEMTLSGDGEVSFSPFEVVLPDYDTRYTQMTPSAATAGPVFVLNKDETPLETTVKGLRGKLTTVERLASGRLRWHVEIYNGTDSTLEIGFNHDGTFLSDDLGNRYRLLAADTNPKPDEVRKPYRASLAPSSSARHWFEFSGPIQGAKQFIFVLGSHDPTSIRFLPVMRNLS